MDDLVHWTKLTRTDARRAFEAGGDAVVERPGPGGPYHLLARQLAWLDEEKGALADSVVALAAFDEHLLGYARRDAVLDPDHATLVDPGRNGVFRWTLVVRGRVVATWKRVPLTHHTRVEITPFAPLSRGVRAAAERALARWGDFVGRGVEPVWRAPAS